MRTTRTLSRFVTLLFLLGFSIQSFSQEEQLMAKAKEQYDRYEYIDAQQSYLRVLEKGYRSAELFKNLGDSYYYNSQFAEAQKWYKELIESYPKEEIEANYFFKYAQCLKSQEKYEEANTYMEQFATRTDNDQRAKIYREHPDYLERIDYQSGRYDMYNLAVNTEFTDYGGTFYNDQYVVFASTRDTLITKRIIDGRTNEAFLELFKANYDKNSGELLEYEKMSNVLNSKFHESSPAFTKDGNTVYFTRIGYGDEKYKRKGTNIPTNRLFVATKNELGEWSEAKPLPINKDGFSMAHPTLNSAEDTMYFVSDMPGGKGNTDIYKVAINPDGTFGTPENLGDRINTEGKETFPFVSASGDLYFASNGHSGLGGLDVFVTKLEPANDEEKLVINVGKPVNSPKDDFAYVIDEVTRRGYVSSNRPGGKGGDDIYSFLETEELRKFCEITIKGVVKDSQTEEIITNAKVTVFDAEYNVIEVMRSDQNGAYETTEKIDCSATYHIRIEKLEYGMAEMQLDTPDTTQVVDLSDYRELRLVRETRLIQPGEDITEQLALNTVYFSFDKYKIKNEAKEALDKVVEAMKKYPEMNIEIRAHTDSRGPKSYNLMLSKKRAEATMEYLISQGIAAERLTAEGYGEQNIINKCVDNVPCSQEEHQQNRRSEFIIIK
ncbi:OmpA family protein [Aquimarina brevivitae]|uniref:WD40 repeat protein n=1 Tax=Aquimarina brevivitae TaxID=323412 RepID=A0A4Q7P003_9FLAO|nr:OmpA family protein [Aquimarina brevivitae]RZS93101.1 WD40 repeat protein [Aquimarina brevivitae]